ncbi:MAG: putative quinol monooxygenase [Sphingobium sp.]
MVAVIATFTVADGQAPAFEKIARTLVEETRANEPGVRLYTLTRSKRQPNQFKMIELYDGKDDFKAHGASAWFQTAFAQMKPLLAEDPVIEILEPIV